MSPTHFLETNFTLHHVVLDFTKTLENSLERSYVPHVQFSLLLTSYISVAYLLQLITNIDTLLCSVFSRHPFSVPGSRPGQHT